MTFVVDLRFPMIQFGRALCLSHMLDKTDWYPTDGKKFLFNFYIFNFLISVICSVYCHEMLKFNLLWTQTQVTSLIVLTLQFHQILGCWTLVLPGNCVLLKQLSVDRCKMFAFLWCICYLFLALQAIHWL